MDADARRLGQLAGMLRLRAGLRSRRAAAAFAIFSLADRARARAARVSAGSCSPRGRRSSGRRCCCSGFGSGCTAGFGALLAELFPTEVRGFAMGTTYNLRARGAARRAGPRRRWAVDAHGLAGGLSVPLVLALAAAWVWTLPETRGIALTSLGKARGVERSAGLAGAGALCRKAWFARTERRRSPRPRLTRGRPGRYRFRLT